MYIRSKVVEGRTYYQIVQGYRDEAGKVRHRTIASLGRSPTIADAIAVEKKAITRLKTELTRLQSYFPPASAIPPVLLKRIELVSTRLTQRDERLTELRRVATLCQAKRS